MVRLEVPCGVEGGPVSWHPRRPHTPSEVQSQSLGPEQDPQSQPGLGGAREGLLSVALGSGLAGLGFPGAGVPSATAWSRTQVGRGLGRAGGAGRDEMQAGERAHGAQRGPGCRRMGACGSHREAP